MKKLKINAAIVDMTKMTEETLANYEEIKLNCAQVLITPETSKLLARYPVSMNVAKVLDVPTGSRVIMLNGNHELNICDTQEHPVVLVANGNLMVKPYAKNALNSYVHVTVNGRLFVPESVMCNHLTVNGSTIRYPEDCELVDGSLVIDARFIRRATEGARYFVTGTVSMTAPGLDSAVLCEKNVQIIAGSGIFLEAYEEASDMLPMSADIKLVPDGFTVVPGGLTMDEAVSLRFGKTLYVMGNMVVPPEMIGRASMFDRLIVTGKLVLPEMAKDEWLPRVQSFGSLWLYKGKRIGNEAQFEITRELREGCEDGLTIVDCALVEIDPEVEPELLKQKVYKIADCASIFCTKAQKAVVTLIASDCAYIGEKQEDKDESGWVHINAASYVLG